MWITLCIDFNHVEFIEAQPFGDKVICERFATPIGKQAIDLMVQSRTQLRFSGQPKKLRIWGSIPKEIGKLGSKLPFIERLGLRTLARLGDIQELRGSQNNQERFPNARFQRTSGTQLRFKNRLKLTFFDGTQRTPKGAGRKAFDN